MITIETYRGPHPLDTLREERAADLLIKVNSLLQELGITSVTVTSGYRTPAHNAAVGGAAHSNHCLALAIDLADNDRQIGGKLMTNLGILKRRDLYIESLAYCETLHNTKWLHIQSRPPRSGNTVFQPYSGLPRLK